MSAHLEGGAVLMVNLRSLARQMKNGAVSAGLFDPELATIGLVNEEGSPVDNIPPRPFMHTTFVLRRQEWMNVVAANLREGKPAATALQSVGRYMVQCIQDTLALAPGLFKANAPRTIRRKKFDYPLLETGRMRRSVKFKLGNVEEQ